MAFAQNYATTMQVTQTNPPIMTQYNQSQIPQAQFTQPSGPYVPQLQQFIPQQMMVPIPAQQYNQLYPPGWQIVENRKRGRKDSPDKPLRVTKQSKLADYWLNPPATTSNKYTPLDNVEQDAQGADQNNKTAQSKDEKVPKPPPLFVDGVKCIAPLSKLLEDIAKDKYEIKALNNDQVKIQPKTTEHYTIIMRALTEKKTEFHTYQYKKERSFRVVLRNLHQTTDITDLKKEIEDLGHTVVNICNIRQRGTKKPLPLFYVELCPGDNNKDIYDVEFLMRSKVKVEPPHQKREVPQCTNCQRYGHTKRFCYRSPRCVKCTGSHSTAQCPRKEKNDQVKCVLCEGNHPANYKGCAIYQELQKKKFPPLRNKSSQPNHATPFRQTQPGISYAQMAREKSQQVQFANNVTQPQLPMMPQQSNDMFELKQMMKGLMEQMGTMLNLLTAVIAKKA